MQKTTSDRNLLDRSAHRTRKNYLEMLEKKIEIEDDYSEKKNEDFERRDINFTPSYRH